MARHWYTMKDAVLAANRLGMEEFCALHSEPVLVAGTISDDAPGSSRYLIVRKSVRTGRIRRGSKPWITIGRTAENDVVVSDHTVSRHHARMCPNADRTGWLIEDRDSRNLTLIDGTQLAAGDSVPIESGQVVRFGRLDFTMLDPAEFHAYLRSG